MSDYGHTLLCEPGFDALCCEEAAFPYIVDNPQRLTAEQIYAEVQKLFGRFQKARDNGIAVDFDYLHIYDWDELIGIL